MTKNKLKNPDELILAAQKSLSSKEYKNLRFPGMFYTDRRKNQLKIMVTPNNVVLALQFMDTFIKTLRRNGNNLIVENGNTYVIIQEEKIDISLREKTRIIKIQENRGMRNKYRPTGILCLRIERYIMVPEREFDDFNKSLEDQIPRILEYLERRAVALKEQRSDLEISERRLKQVRPTSSI